MLRKSASHIEFIAYFLRANARRLTTVDLTEKTAIVFMDFGIFNDDVDGYKYFLDLYA